MHARCSVAAGGFTNKEQFFCELELRAARSIARVGRIEVRPRSQKAAAAMIPDMYLAQHERSRQQDKAPHASQGFSPLAPHLGLDEILPPNGS